jgi:hypothetical protein
MKSRFLFEVRPDVFPEGRLTDVEIALWARFFTDKAAANQHG